jgi:hypothetical protein
VAIGSELIRTLAHSLSVETGWRLSSNMRPLSHEGGWRNANASIAAHGFQHHVDTREQILRVRHGHRHGGYLVR